MSEQALSMPANTSASAAPSLGVSLPGSTRQSICFAKTLLEKEMDARVKPAHDGAARTSIFDLHDIGPLLAQIENVTDERALIPYRQACVGRGNLRLAHQKEVDVVGG